MLVSVVYRDLIKLNNLLCIKPLKPEERDTFTSIATMNVYSCLFLFAVFQIMAAREIKSFTDCNKPPPPVLNMMLNATPLVCCPLPNIFNAKEIYDCGLGDRTTDNIPECHKTLCLYKKYGLTRGDEIDFAAWRAFLDQFVLEHPEFIDTIEIVKDKCLQKNLVGAPGIRVCPANLLTYCVNYTMILNCPVWQETTDCMLLKDFLNKCKKRVLFPLGR